MKEYSLVERLILILKVFVSIISWVSRILFKIVRDVLPGSNSSTVAGTPSGGADRAPPSK